jgi:osmotically-inducible protein OsmY
MGRLGSNRAAVAALWLGLSLAAGGCNPYVAAISATYGVATDLRPVGVQASDTEIEAAVKAALLDSPVEGTGGLRAYCRQGIVVLTGVVPPGSPAGQAAVQLAQQTPGVAQVETFFVPSAPSPAGDLEIEAAVKAAFVEDPNLFAERVDIAVYGGNVALIGVVDSQAHAEQFIAEAQGVPGVLSVRSDLQSVQ